MGIFHPDVPSESLDSARLFLLDAGVSRGAIGDRTGHVHQSSSSSIGGSRCFPLRGRSIRRLIDRGAPLGYIWGRVSRYFFCFVLFCFVFFWIFCDSAEPRQAAERPAAGGRKAEAIGQLESLLHLAETVSGWKWASPDGNPETPYSLGVTTVVHRVRCWKNKKVDPFSFFLIGMVP